MAVNGAFLLFSIVTSLYLIQWVWSRKQISSSNSHSPHSKRVKLFIIHGMKGREGGS